MTPQRKPRRSIRSRHVLHHAVRASAAVRIESLEERRLLTITVTSTGDDGPGTLREAITQANSHGGDDIAFNIADSGMHKIELASALPEITSPVTIDGTTQPGYVSGGAPVIWIDAAMLVDDPEGLVISGGASTVKGLALTNLLNGITLAGDGGNTVQACYIGISPTNPTDPVPADWGTGQYGIEVVSAGNVIEGNFIANSHSSGVHVAGLDTVIEGNTVGMSPSGLLPIGNGGDGVLVDGNLGGGDTTITGNLISGNAGNGVHVIGASGVIVRDNRIGTDTTGLVSDESIGNQGDGVLLAGGSTGNTIGGDGATDRNVISGNNADGVEIQDSNGNYVVGNYIGIAYDGAAGGDTLGNLAQGLEIDGSSTGNVVRGGNVVSGNHGYGVSLSGPANVVRGNFIGTGPGGVGAIGNQQDGVHIESGGNLIGSGGIADALDFEKNVIAYNGYAGVAVGSGTSNTIRGNSIHDNSQDEFDDSVEIDLLETTHFGDIVRGRTLNGTSSADGEPNLFQNFPVITSVHQSGSTATIAGTLDAAAAGTYVIDFYASPSASPSGYGAGARYLGSTTVSADAAGTFGFSTPVTGLGLDDVQFTATATDAAGNTSEFSQAEQAVIASTVSTYTQLSSDHNPSVFGQSVTLTAAVSVSPGVPATSGQVRFSDGATVLATVTVNAAGVATYTAPAGFSIGAHTLAATYLGDTSFNGSSDTLTQTVNRAASSTSVSTSPNPSQFGQTVTLTATVSSVAPGAGTPTGSVVFKDGTTVLGTGTLDAAGVATFGTSALGVGSHMITAEYAGDASFTASSNFTEQTVNPAATTTTVASSVNPSVFGQAVTLTATVASAAGTPGGTVEFFDGATSLGTVTLASGAASISIATLGVGSHNITAVYGGDANFGASTSAALAQAVNAAATHTSVGSSLDPSTLGQSVTFTATVTVDAPGAGTPTGTVTFFDGGTPIGSATLSGSAASISVASLGVGSHNVTAVYAGSASFTTSTSAALAQVVNQATSQTTLASSVNPSAYGQSVTFTATVTTPAGLPASTGAVTFMDGATVLGTGAVSGGVAIFSTAGLSVGAHAITATYGGDGNYTASSSPAFTQNVQQAASTTTLASSANPSTVGQSVTLTATIAVGAPGAATPTGTVTFTDGATTLGTVTLAGGVASLNVTFASAGAHNIVATYSGDANVAGSGKSLTQTVNPAATTTTLTSSANPSDVGQSVTFTATVAGSGAGTPTCTVTFCDGSTVLATANLVGGVATFTTSALASGSHAITAIYNGAANYATSSAGLTQVVRAPAPSTLSGYVYVDRNNDGVKQSTEQGIGCVTVKLVNAAGQIVGTATTDCSGAYSFANVVAGVYTIIETQPAHYVDGIESAGSLGGDDSGDNNTISAIPVGSGQNGVNYNFGELPETFVDSGDTATIGFWHNKNGQNLIKSFNGGASATQLATWLSTSFPHIYGSGLPNSLVGKNNNDVAALFMRLFNVSGQKLDAQVLGVALAVYSTTNTLGGNAAAKYGFNVDAIGTGHALYNVTSNGAAFGVANNTKMEVLDILTACDVRAVNGVLYNGNTGLRNMANTVFDGINQQGDIA